jgi:hypothetical protein
MLIEDAKLSDVTSAAIRYYEDLAQRHLAAVEARNQ